MTIDESLSNHHSGFVTVSYFVLNNSTALEAVRLIPSGAKLAEPDKVLVWQDQAVPPNAPEASAGQRDLMSFAKSYHTGYSYGTGMAPQLFRDDQLKAGSVVVSCDPAIRLVGAYGALGLCLTAQDMSQALLTGKASVKAGKTFKVKLQGTLPPKTDWRDVAFQVVSEAAGNLPTDGVLEFYLAPELHLTTREKMLLCGETLQAGNLTALIGEGDVSQEQLLLDLSTVQPFLAKPHAILPLSLTKTQKICSVFIGGACGGFLEDIKKTAALLDGKQVAYKVRLYVAPATAETYVAAADAGYLTTIMEAGGMILNHCASPVEQARIGDGEIMVSNDLHNEPLYAGPETSGIYLASTYTAVASALSGRIGGQAC